MTEKKANELLRTKYPEAEIVRQGRSSAPKGKYFVTFQPLGKVYYYSAPNYSALLGKLGIKGFEDFI